MTKTGNIFIQWRKISTTCTNSGKRNFRKFWLYNKRGSRALKEAQRAKEENTIPIDHQGVRSTGIERHGKFVEIKAKIPELIVPNLNGCGLQPYVSYRTTEVYQSEFTSLDLFNAIYANKIMKDFNSNMLSNDGNPKNPSAEEMLDSDVAWKKARKTGSDIF